MAFNKINRRLRLRRGIRKKIKGTDQRPRLSVFKSNKSIYAQLINDEKAVTLTSSSTLELGLNLNVQNAKEVGKRIAEKATSVGIKQIVFDRGGYLYHGKIKALADGAREKGLKF